MGKSVKKVYRGFIYRNAKDLPDSHTDLTKKQLKDMRLEGLPMRVEHSGSEIEVGKIERKHDLTAEGDMLIDFSLNDDAAGAMCSHLIENGGLPELSLKHTLNLDTGIATPEEVSIVRKGLFVTLLIKKQ